MFVPVSYSAAGWFTGALLIVFAFVIWRTVVPGMSWVEVA
jgi:hypothetical protein